MTVSSNRRGPLFDVHPLTGASIEVFYADGLAKVRQARRWLVLVVSAARFRAYRTGTRSVCHNLSGVSRCAVSETRRP